MSVQRCSERKGEVPRSRHRPLSFGSVTEPRKEMLVKVPSFSNSSTPVAGAHGPGGHLMPVLWPVPQRGAAIEMGSAQVRAGSPASARQRGWAWLGLAGPGRWRPNFPTAPAGGSPGRAPGVTEPAAPTLTKNQTEVWALGKQNLLH